MRLPIPPSGPMPPFKAILVRGPCWPKHQGLPDSISPAWASQTPAFSKMLGQPGDGRSMVPVDLSHLTTCEVSHASYLSNTKGHHPWKAGQCPQQHINS